MPFTGISLNLTLRGDILLETPLEWRAVPLPRQAAQSKTVPFYLRITLVNPCQANGAWDCPCQALIVIPVFTS